MPAASSPRRKGEHGGSLGSFLQDAERRLERFDRAVMDHDWALYTGRSKGGGTRVELARADYLRGLSLPPPPKVRDDGGASGLVRRRFELLKREVLDAYTEQDPDILRLRRALQRRIVAFRPRWEGKRVGRQVVRDIVRTDRDVRRRRKAFYAEAPLFRAIEPALRRLILRRNRQAQKRGFETFADLRLGFEGLTVSRLESLLDSVLRRARLALREFRSEFLHATQNTEWFPWDVGYALERAAALPEQGFPARTMTRDVLNALRRWGFEDDQLRFRVVRHDLPFGGLTFPVHVPTDVRVLVHPRGSWESYLVLFHEFGHAVHARSVRQPSHLLRNGQGFAAYQEGIADLFEEIAFLPRWLATRPGVEPEAIARFRAGRRGESLVRATQTALSVRLELDLYRDPDHPPLEEHHERARRTLGFGEYDPPSWANTLYVTHPVYTQSYFLSLLFRKQVVEALHRELGPDLWPNDRIGPWLTTHLFSQGARRDWLTLVKEATGRPLGVDPFLRSALAATN